MDKSDYTCAACDDQLVEPYIECCECENISLCTACFASGRELREHKNNHSYAVRKNNFYLFENCNWTAKEEYKLLHAISTCGYGNWEEVSKILQTRSKIECQEHYKKYYIDQVQQEDLEILLPTEQSVFCRPIIPYLFNTTNGCEDPPRTLGNQHVAGYNAYRSDFELSFDSTAESIFNVETHFIDDDDDQLMQELQISLFHALNSRLKERQRRYAIIQKHGLILLRKFKCWLQRFDKTIGRTNAERFLPFVQLSEGDEFNRFLETISYEKEKYQKLMRLCEYRRMGIKTLYGAKVFEEMRIRHEQQLKDQKYYTIAISHKFEQKLKYVKGYIKSPSKMSKIPKKPVMPLYIVDLPDYNLLSDSEKDLCSRLRLIPKAYLDLKDQFIIENNKMGNLKLLDARRIAKIDVNKTRKIYDFLAAQGFITQPLN